MESIILVSDGEHPLYVQIYNYFKNEIERGTIGEGEKLPSIRGLAKALSVSKITVEMAYQQLLSEGYIENANRARYTVAALEGEVLRTWAKPAADAKAQPIFQQLPQIRYDFSSGEMDPEGFDFGIWKRYINKALGEPSRLVGYGHVQGEPELREQIARYIRQSRGVSASSDQIIIGPGVQSLLGTLCSLMKGEHTRIAFEDPGFKNGRRVFADHGFDILPIRMRRDGIDMDELSQSGAGLVYVSPSHQFPTGSIMPIGKRNRLLAWAQSVQGIIVEDDYDSEFRYYGRPIPALKGLDQHGRVVYLGSFSKIMPPSIRMSYMVLPDVLLERFLQRAPLYNQGASTAEQLALASFMEDGQLEKQIRRLRKRYQEKRQIFLSAIKEYLGDRVIVQEGESGLFTLLDIQSDLSAHELARRALEKGCRVAVMQDYSLMQDMEQNMPSRLILYFSSIPVTEIEQAVGLLRSAWFS